MQTCSPSILLFAFSTHTLSSVPVDSCPWQLQAKSLKSSQKCRRPFTRHSTLAALALSLSLVSVHVLLLFDYVRTLLQLLLLALFLCCFSLSWLSSSHIWPSVWQVIRGIILIARINPWMNGQPRLDFPSRIPRLLVFPAPPLPSLSIPFFVVPR